MTRIKMHISKAKFFYPPCEVKCELKMGCQHKEAKLYRNSQFMTYLVN